MNFLGILRASALFTLVSAFHGQPVGCGILNGILSSKKYSNANPSENSEEDLAAQVKMLQAKLQALEAGLDNTSEESSTVSVAESTVESPLVEEAEESTVESQDAVPEDRKEPHGPSDFSNEFNSEYEEKEPIKEAEKSNEEYEQHHVASYPSTINLPDGSNNLNGSMATPSSNGAAEDMEADREKMMQKISEDLKDSPVKSQVAENPSQESSSKSSAPLPQSGLVFESSTWDDSMLANAVLFLEEFCKEVKGDKFSGKVSGKSYDGLSWACLYVSIKLESVTNHFVPTYGPGSVDKRKEIDMDFYKSKLKPEKFEVYAKWIVENIAEIQGSFRRMLEESVTLTDTSVGPLKYGFVFRGDWKGWKWLIRWIPLVWFNLEEVTSGIVVLLELLHSQLSEIL
ncbi:secreted antigen 1 [Babesia divergens]|uniref:Secreted antigen 1 n=1 Tax=Babesia divergens TaxID=32595 RepID=A0AAD9GD16_BABDI|nr:secreted antigen 1 [Babesia divergens]